MISDDSKSDRMSLGHQRKNRHEVASKLLHAPYAIRYIRGKDLNKVNPSLSFSHQGTNQNAEIGRFTEGGHRPARKGKVQSDSPYKFYRQGRKAD